MATVIVEKLDKKETLERNIEKKAKVFDAKQNQEQEIIEYIKRFLPYRLCAQITELEENLIGRCERIEEIRLRSGMNTYITLGGDGSKRNVHLRCILMPNEIMDVLERMCDGSLYSYSESIISGYISIGNGVRVGVCGRAAVEDDKIHGVYNISSLNIRLPCKNVKIDRGIGELIRNSVLLGEGVLIYSPPSQGKTTLLRSLAYALSGEPSALRVVLVDTRDELGGLFDQKASSLDILSGYPKAEGIRIATAFMSPQVIICDEIGSESEAIAISQAQNCGVPLIASAHGTSAEAIMRRSGMRVLHESGAFGVYIGISIGSYKNFEYKVQKRGDIK